MPDSAQPTLLIAAAAFTALLLIAAGGWMSAALASGPETGQPGLAEHLEAALKR